MGDMIMSKVFKRLPMRAFQRTSNHERMTDQTFFIDKSFNPPSFSPQFGRRFFSSETPKKLAKNSKSGNTGQSWGNTKIF